MFRKALLYIRKNYNAVDTRKRFLTIWGVVFAVSALTGVLVDVLLPFAQWWNVLRALIVIPAAAAGFVLAYSWSLFLHYRKIVTDYTWEPYRARLSASGRRRMSAIVAAVGAVILYANSINPSFGYTFVTILLAILTIGLFAYMRPSKAEARREILDIPDARDVRYEQKKAQIAQEQLDKERDKKRRKEEEKLARRKPRKEENAS